MKAKIRGVCINSILPTLDVSLWHSRKKLCKRFINRDLEAPRLLDAPGQAFGKHDGCCFTWFVLIEVDVDEVPLYSQLALLAHEATHVANWYFETHGEDEIGEEAYAYTVQAICDALFDEHLRWLEKRKKRSRRKG